MRALLLFLFLVSSASATLCPDPPNLKPSVECDPTGTCVPTLGNCGALIRKNEAACAAPSSQEVVDPENYARLCRNPDGTLAINDGSGPSSIGGGSGACPTKGDLLGSTGSGTSCVPVGATGKRLTADPSAPTGWAWRDDIVRLSRTGFTTVTNSSTDTDLSVSDALGPLTAGTVIHFVTSGTIKKGGTDTALYNVKLGGQTIAQVSLVTGMMSTSATPYAVDVVCTVQTAGTGGVTQCRTNVQVDDTTFDTTFLANGVIRKNTTAVDVLTAPVVIKTTIKFAAGTSGDELVEEQATLDVGVPLTVLIGGTTTTSTTTTTTSTTTTTVAGGDAITDTNANNVQDWWTNAPPNILPANAARQDVKGAVKGAITKIDACLGNAGSTGGTAFLQVYPGACPTNGGTFGGAQLGPNSDSINITSITNDISGSPNGACGSAGTGSLMTFTWLGTQPNPGSGDYCVVLQNEDVIRWGTSGGSSTSACPGSTCYQNSTYDVWIPNSTTRPNQDYIFNVWRLP